MSTRPYVPTAADVRAVLAAEQDRPQNLTDLSMSIAALHHLAWAMDRPVVSQTVLRRILDEMVGGSEVMLLRGSDWRANGITFLHLRESGWYYGAPENVARWEQAAAAKAEQAALDKARQDALLVLRDRHPAEYEQIVADTFALRAHAA